MMQQERFLLIPADGDIDEDEGLTKAEILGMLGRELLSNGDTTEKKASELLEESAAPFDAACVMVRSMERELEQLRLALEELVNEPQPLGIDRPAYQHALAALM
ncbi:MAG: hypothetical protein OQL08_08995 [Gammaproteobacteria bacterium]|nr:hypothetical protein [Gammaproteobacteria bacterium]